ERGALGRPRVHPTAQRTAHPVVLGRLLGVRRAADGGGGRLPVDLTPDSLRRLPEAHPGLVVPPGEHWHPPNGYVVDNFLRLVEAFIGQSPYVPPVEVDLDARSRHEIAAGSPVWSGRRQLGKVTRVVADPDGSIRELVVRHGVLDGDRRVPASRLTEVVGTNVHVDLGEEESEALPRE